MGIMEIGRAPIASSPTTQGSNSSDWYSCVAWTLSSWNLEQVYMPCKQRDMRASSYLRPGVSSEAMAQYCSWLKPMGSEEGMEMELFRSNRLCMQSQQDSESVTAGQKSISSTKIREL